jgi:hypothetical protein
MKKEKITLSFASPEKENYFFNICYVITSPEKEKSSANHYSSQSPSRSLETARPVGREREGSAGGGGGESLLGTTLLI